MCSNRDIQMFVLGMFNISAKILHPFGIFQRRKCISFLNHTSFLLFSIGYETLQNFMTLIFMLYPRKPVFLAETVLNLKMFGQHSKIVKYGLSKQNLNI